MPAPPHWLKLLIKEEALPSSFESLAMDYCLPLAESIVAWTHTTPSPLVVGVNGAQGTGKSTLSKVLSLTLEQQHQLRCAIISIDDIYLTRQQRTHLATEVHPLLMTRGVPGTHDVSMGIELIHQLKNKQPATLPIFDKAIDDRTPSDQAQQIPLVDLNLIATERWTDLLSGQSYSSQDTHLELPPYGCVWISNLT